MNIPYVGITEFMTFEQVERMLKVFKTNLKPQHNRRLHIGVMMSYKSLYGIQSKFSTAFPAKESIAKIFSSDETIFAACQYNTFRCAELWYSFGMKKGQDYTGVTIVYLCHDGKGNVLLNKRSVNCRDEHGTWDPGGGGLEFGDSVENTLKKEIAEEYCTDVLYYTFLGYRDVHREHEGVKTHWIALDFKVLIDRDKVSNGEPHKFDSLEWFTLDTLPKPLHSQFPKFLELYKEELNFVSKDS